MSAVQRYHADRVSDDSDGGFVTHADYAALEAAAGEAARALPLGLHPHGSDWRCTTCNTINAALAALAACGVKP